MECYYRVMRRWFVLVGVGFILLSGCEDPSFLRSGQFKQSHREEVKPAVTFDVTMVGDFLRVEVDGRTEFPDGLKAGPTLLFMVPKDRIGKPVPITDAIGYGRMPDENGDYKLASTNREYPDSARLTVDRVDKETVKLTFSGFGWSYSRLEERPFYARQYGQ